MNAQRLHAIAVALHAELAQAETPALLQQLAAALRQVVEEPSQPSHQQTVSDTRKQLENVLAAAPSNEFSPAWRAAVDELGVAELLGERLQAQIRSIFERN